MGENVLQGQVESFKKGLDKAMAQLLTKDLFVIKEVFEEEFIAEPIGMLTLREGDNLVGYCKSDANEIQLVKGHLPVGQIVGDGAVHLNNAVLSSGLPGVIPLRVSSISKISGCFKVQHIGV